MITVRGASARTRSTGVAALLLAAAIMLVSGSASSASEAPARGVPPTSGTGAVRFIALEGVPWLLLELDGAIVQLPAGERQPYLLFLQQERKVTGFSGCNEFTGGYELKGDALSFGPLAATRRFCAGAAGDIEQAFLGAIGKVSGWRVDRQMLLLLGGDRVLVRLQQELMRTPQ
jgi:heat shock protein HslJ